MNKKIITILVMILLVNTTLVIAEKHNTETYVGRPSESEWPTKDRIKINNKPVNSWADFEKLNVREQHIYITESLQQSQREFVLGRLELTRARIIRKVPTDPFGKLDYWSKIQGKMGENKLAIPRNPWKVPSQAPTTAPAPTPVPAPTNTPPESPQPTATPPPSAPSKEPSPTTLEDALTNLKQQIDEINKNIAETDKKFNELALLDTELPDTILELNKLKQKRGSLVQKRDQLVDSAKSDQLTKVLQPGDTYQLTTPLGKIETVTVKKVENDRVIFKSGSSVPIESFLKSRYTSTEAPPSEPAITKPATPTPERLTTDQINEQIERLENFIKDPDTLEEDKERSREAIKKLKEQLPPTTTTAPPTEKQDANNQPPAPAQANNDAKKEPKKNGESSKPTKSIPLAGGITLGEEKKIITVGEKTGDKSTGIVKSAGTGKKDEIDITIKAGDTELVKGKFSKPIAQALNGMLTNAQWDDNYFYTEENNKELRVSRAGLESGISREIKINGEWKPFDNVQAKTTGTGEKAETYLTVKNFQDNTYTVQMSTETDGSVEYNTNKATIDLDVWNDLGGIVPANEDPILNGIINLGGGRTVTSKQLAARGLGSDIRDTKIYKGGEDGKSTTNDVSERRIDMGSNDLEGSDDFDIKKTDKGVYVGDIFIEEATLADKDIILNNNIFTANIISKDDKIEVTKDDRGIQKKTFSKTKATGGERLHTAYDASYVADEGARTEFESFDKSEPDAWITTHPSGNQGKKLKNQEYVTLYEGEIVSAFDPTIGVLGLGIPFFTGILTSLGETITGGEDPTRIATGPIIDITTPEEAKNNRVVPVRTEEGIKLFSVANAVYNANIDPATDKPYQYQNKAGKAVSQKDLEKCKDCTKTDKFTNNLESRRQEYTPIRTGEKHTKQRIREIATQDAVTGTLPAIGSGGWAELKQAKGPVTKGLGAIQIVVNLAEDYVPHSALSRAAFGKQWLNDWSETVDMAFTPAYLGQTHFVSAICRKEPKIDDAGAIGIETPTGQFQFIGSIQAQKSEPVPIPCQLNPNTNTTDYCKEGTCADDGFCYKNNELVTGQLYIISYGVQAPSDEKLTPERDEAGAVSYNIQLTGEESPTLFNNFIELQNGQTNKEAPGGQSPIIRYSPKKYDQACLVFGKRPKDRFGNKISQSYCRPIIQATATGEKTTTPQALGAPKFNYDI